MNDRLVGEFCRRYQARVIAVPPSKKIDYTFSYNPYTDTTATESYYHEAERKVEIELSLRAFEYLLKIEQEAETEYHNRKEESLIRASNPMVDKAYEQYKMLLELCR